MGKQKKIEASLREETSKALAQLEIERQGAVAAKSSARELESELRKQARAIGLATVKKHGAEQKVEDAASVQVSGNTELYPMTPPDTEDRPQLFPAGAAVEVSSIAEVQGEKLEERQEPNPDGIGNACTANSGTA